MAAMSVEDNFLRMKEAEFRRRVEANPGRVNDIDEHGYTSLIYATMRLESVPLVTWLLDEKGADVNVVSSTGSTPLHVVKAPDIVNVLLDRGADPARVNMRKWSPLIQQTFLGTAEVVTRLLQDPRVRATVNMQDRYGETALHHACKVHGAEAAPRAALLVQVPSRSTSFSKLAVIPPSPTDTDRRPSLTFDTTVPIIMPPLPFSNLGPRQGPPPRRRRFQSHHRAALHARPGSPRVALACGGAGASGGWAESR